MIFPKTACLILGLAVLSLAQRDIGELFQVDFSTNAEGGCNYVGAYWLNKMVQDCVWLLNSFISAIDDMQDQTSPFQRPATKLINRFFGKGIILGHNDLALLKRIYYY